MRVDPVRILPVAAIVLVIAALTIWLVAGIGVLTVPELPLYFAVEGACWLLLVPAVLLLKRVRSGATAVVLIGTALLGVCGASGPPTISTDSARYNWDGIVQDAGISPYAHVPADAALAPLRPEWLFPPVQVAADGSERCPGPKAALTAQVGAPGRICTNINRPLVPTIYPPVAEALFAAARIAVPRDVEYLPMQLLGLLVVLGTTALLLRALRTAGLDPRLAAIYGWCPYVTMEAVVNAHVDAAAALLALAATVLIARGRRLSGGLVLGLAIATKFTPLLIAPPLLRRRPWAVVGGAAATVVAVYVPHVLAVGPSVIGYLPGYLNEEGYDSGTRSVLLSAVLPDSASTVVAVLALAVLAVVLLLRSDPSDPWRAQVVMVGTALLLLSPRYGWYSLLLVPFIVMSRRWEWFGVVIALSVLGLQGERDTLRLLLLGAAALPVAAFVWRRRAPRNLTSD